MTSGRIRCRGRYAHAAQSGGTPLKKSGSPPPRQYLQAVRRLVKTGIARGLHCTGADGLIGTLAGVRRLPVVLGYHSVVEDVEAHADGALPGMMVSRRQLAQQLDWLGRNFRLVSLDELGERLERGEGQSEPIAAVTFDDGYQDVYEHAFPLLQEKGIPAAVFVVTDLIETSAIQLHDALYAGLASARGQSGSRDLGRLLHGVPEVDELNVGARSPFAAMRLLLQALPQDRLLQVVRALEDGGEIDKRALRALRPLTWKMVAEMSRAGITVGSHTRSHPVLTNESPQTVREEVAGSRWVLEQVLGVPVRHFAYPGGYFNRAVVSAVADAGYRFGYTICRHRDPQRPLLTIPRTMLWETSCLDTRGRFSAATMSCLTHGLFNTRCRDAHGGSGGARIPCA